MVKAEAEPPGGKRRQDTESSVAQNPLNAAGCQAFVHCEQNPKCLYSPCVVQPHKACSYSQHLWEVSHCPSTCCVAGIHTAVNLSRTLGWRDLHCLWPVVFLHLDKRNAKLQAQPPGRSWECFCPNCLALQSGKAGFLVSHRDESCNWKSNLKDIITNNEKQILSNEVFHGA